MGKIQAGDTMQGKARQGKQSLTAAGHLAARRSQVLWALAESHDQVL